MIRDFIVGIACIGALVIWGRPSPRVVVARERGREAAVEHLDRRCCNCNYGWTTAIAPAKEQVGFKAA